MADPSPDPATAKPAKLGRPWQFLVLGLSAMAVLVVLGQIRLAGLVLGASLTILALLRAIVPSSAMGALAVRSRTTDVVLLGATAAAVLTIALTLRIP